MSVSRITRSITVEHLPRVPAQRRPGHVHGAAMPAPKMTFRGAAPIPDPKAIALPTTSEPSHIRVFRLIAEGNIEQAAGLAARMINARQDQKLFWFQDQAKLSEASRWLSRKLEEGLAGPCADFETITPAAAQLMLQSNEGNRSVNPAYLAKFMRDVLADRFAVNGEAIIVAVCGHLNDGQKRLWAALLCNKNIRSNTSWGVTRESQKTIDVGQIRSVRDILTIDGVASGHYKAAIAQLAFEMFKGRQPTRQEAHDYYHENADKMDAAFDVVGSQKRGASRSALAVAAYYFLARGVKQEALRPFFRMLHTGNNAPRTIMVLRDHITMKGVQRSTNTRQGWVYLVAHHINAWRKNKQLIALKNYSEFPPVR